MNTCAKNLQPNFGFGFKFLFFFHLFTLIIYFQINSVEENNSDSSIRDERETSVKVPPQKNGHQRDGISSYLEASLIPNSHITTPEKEQGLIENNTVHRHSTVKLKVGDASDNEDGTDEIILMDESFDESFEGRHPVVKSEEVDDEFDEIAEYNSEGESQAESDAEQDGDAHGETGMSIQALKNKYKT